MTMTAKKLKFIEEKAKSPTASNSEIARRAGYKPGNSARNAGYNLTRKDDEVAKRIQELGEVGLDTLHDVAKNGRVEVARVQAGKALVEQAYGQNQGKVVPNVTINVNKLSELAQ